MPQPIPLKDHGKEQGLVNRRLIACALLVLALSIAYWLVEYKSQASEPPAH